MNCACTNLRTGDAYAFLLDVNQYFLVMIYGAVVVALFIIRQHVPSAEYPFRVWTWVPYLFLACQVFLLLSPLVSPSGAGDTNLPFWLAPSVSFLVIGLGTMYWRLKSFVAAPAGDEPFWTRQDNPQSYGSVAAS